MKSLLTSTLLTVFAVPFLMAAPATKAPAAKQDTTQTTKTTKKSHSKKHSKKSTATSTAQSK